MVNVNFSCHSPLYGYSFLWLLRQTVVPSISWPDFGATKNPHVLSQIPLVGRLLQYDLLGISIRAFRRQLRFILALGRQSIICIHLWVMFESIILSIEHQKQVLEQYGQVKESALSYKVARYMPTIYVSKRYSDDSHSLSLYPSLS